MPPPSKDKHFRRRRSSQKLPPSDSFSDESDSSEDLGDLDKNAESITFEKLIKELSKERKSPDEYTKWLESATISQVCEQISEDPEKLARLAVTLSEINSPKMLPAIRSVISQLEDTGKKGAPSMRCVFDALQKPPKFLNGEEYSLKQQKKMYGIFSAIFGLTSNLDKPYVHQVGLKRFSEILHPYYLSMASVRQWNQELSENEKVEQLETQVKCTRKIAELESQDSTFVESVTLQYLVQMGPYWGFDKPDGDQQMSLYQQLFVILIRAATENRKKNMSLRALDLVDPKGEKVTANDFLPGESDISEDEDEANSGSFLPTVCEWWLYQFFCYLGYQTVDKLALDRIEELLALFLDSKLPGHCTVEDLDKKLYDIECQCKTHFCYDDEVETTVYRLIEKYPGTLAKLEVQCSAIVQRWLKHPTFEGFNAFVRLYPTRPEAFSPIFERMFQYVHSESCKDAALELVREAAIVDPDALQKHHVHVLEKFLRDAQSTDTVQNMLVILLTLVENRTDLAEGCGNDYLDIVVSQGLDETCLCLAAEVLILRATLSEQEARLALGSLFKSSSEPAFQIRSYQQTILEGLQAAASLFPKVVKKYQPYISAAKENPFLRKEAIQLQETLNGKRGAQKKSGGNSCTVL